MKNMKTNDFSILILIMLSLILMCAVFKILNDKIIEIQKVQVGCVKRVVTTNNTVIFTVPEK